MGREDQTLGKYQETGNRETGEAGRKEMNEPNRDTGARLVNVFEGKELIVSEQERLAELENTISKNFKAFYVVGCALAEIQVNRLYRQTHGTFEEYCRERFEIARRTAYRYIEASTVMENVTNWSQAKCFPANEAQVRPLIRLEPEKQVDAWKEAVETAPDGHVTAKHVSKVVRQILGEQVREKAEQLKDKKNVPEDIVPREFKEAYWILVDIVRSELMAGTMKEKTRTRMLENIQGLLQLLSD